MKITGRIAGKGAWLVRQLTKRVWLRTVLFSIGAVAVAVVAGVIGPYLPYQPDLELASGAVESLLNIIATSMLSVTTFSLSIAVSAYASATSNVTPRSTKLLLADPVAQTTLSTFVGSFLFAVVGIVGLSAGLYNDRGRIVLFLATLMVLAIITGSLLRWIDVLGRFGRVGDTTHRVEKAAHDALVQAGKCPRIGARRIVTPLTGAADLFAERHGPVTHIDTEELDELAEEYGLTIELQLLPGSIATPRRPILRVRPQPDDAVRKKLVGAVTIDQEREFENDPRFGLVVLSEIASRALSPAVNDPGTAIDTLGAGLRVLTAHAAALAGADPPRCTHVHAPDLPIDDLVTTLFDPIVRDGAAMGEVLERVVRTASALAAADAMFEGPARGVVERVRASAEKGLATEWESARLAAVIAEEGFAAA